MEFRVSHIIKFTLTYLLGSFLFAIITSLVLYGNVRLFGTSLLFTIIFFTAYLSAIFGILFFRYFALKSQKQIARKIIPAVILFWIGALFIATIVISLVEYLWQSKSNASIIYELNFSDLLHALKALGPWIFVSSIIFFYVLWRKGVSREQKLREKLLIFKYQTLKNQVNPHFLFNSLNALSSLINIDPVKADRFTNKLSEVYRYILLNEDKHLVPLDAELDFVKDYFELQKIRDEEKILLDIKIENPENYFIVPVSVQVLLENALKHNSATRNTPLKIKIFEDSECLIVSNNLQQKTNLESSSKTGLKNLNERIKLILNRELIVSENRDEFIVSIPIKQKQ
ncbi:MAG: histidine kinase [Bacteroidales bacterium]|nr:histidine kinase [Bacteroidales bacterium]